MMAYHLKGLTKNVKLGDQKLSILKNIHLDIPAGQYVAIVGPSGSGKSTLMQMLGCLDVPSSGQLKILDKNVLKLTDDESARLRCRAIGFIFQSFHLLPYYTARANVELAMVYRGHLNSSARAKTLLKSLGLGERMDAKPVTLSGGEKQRVAIARAIANKPKILLADEPTGSLDQANGKMVLDILSQLNKMGTTVVLVTHDLNVANRAHRTIEIVDGRIHSDRKTRS